MLVLLEVQLLHNGHVIASEFRAITPSNIGSIEILMNFFNLIQEFLFDHDEIKKKRIQKFKGHTRGCHARIVLRRHACHWDPIGASCRWCRPPGPMSARC